MDINEENNDLIKKLQRQKELNAILKDKQRERLNEIEQLKIKQFELETIINEASIAIIIGDKKGKILNINKKLLEITGYTNKDLFNKNISYIITNNSIPESFSRKDPTEPTNEFANEQFLIKKNGIKIFVSTVIKLLSDGRYKIVLRDIDLRKKAELSLIESEKRYRILTNNIHDVVWTTDLKLNTLFISKSISKITGFKPSIYYQKNIKNLITTFSYRLILDTIKKETKKIKSGKIQKKDYSISLEIKLLHKKGKDVWMKLSATFMLNNKNEATGLHGVMYDITEHKKTLKILDYKEKKFNLALKSANAGIWELNVDLTEIIIDDNLLYILGYNNKKPEILISDWLNITYKKDRTYLIDILQDILDKKYLSKTYECRRVHKDGYILWFSDTVNAVIDENDNIIGLITTSKDITQQKITEEKKYKYYAKLQLLIDSAIHFLQLSNLNSIYEYLGETLLRSLPESIIILSSSKADVENSRIHKYYGIITKDYNKLTEEIDFIPFENNKLSDNLKAILKKEILIEYKGGFNAYVKDNFLDSNIPAKAKELQLENIYFIGLKENDKVYACITIITKIKYKVDNQEFIEALIHLASINLIKKSIEIKLNNEKEKALESKHRLKKLNAQKDKFFSIISHDLKSPFNSIIGFSNLITKDPDSFDKAKIQQFCRLINQTATNSYELLENLFSWAKSQSGSLEIETKTFSINNLISTNIDLFNSEAIRKEIKLFFNSKNDFKITSDKNILNTILRNLLSNALKFTNQNGKVEVFVDKTNDFFQIKVKDNGVGIEKKLHKKIFNIETNTSTKGTDNEKGTGLGLVLCKEYVEKLNGKIWVESEINKGSSFIFTIPK